MRIRSRSALTLQVICALVVALAMCTSRSKASVTVNAPTSVQWGDHADVNTINNTRYESWVDISWSYLGQGWHIEKAFCLKPNQSYQYHVSYNHPSLQPQLRVRAEIKLAGCARGTHTVVSGDGRVAKTAERFTVTINEHPAGHFFMTFPGTR